MRVRCVRVSVRWFVIRFGHSDTSDTGIRGHERSTPHLGDGAALGQAAQVAAHVVAAHMQLWQGIYRLQGRDPIGPGGDQLDDGARSLVEPVRRFGHFGSSSGGGEVTPDQRPRPTIEAGPKLPLHRVAGRNLHRGLGLLPGPSNHQRRIDTTPDALRAVDRVEEVGGVLLAGVVHGDQR